MVLEKVTIEKRRSKAYPAISLADALEKIKKINTNLGITGRFNRESIAAGMGFKSLNGSSSRRVAALVHYGLLGREKDKYFLSDLAKKYLLPTDDDHEEKAIREAALTPTLFFEIYSSFEGQVLPRQFVNRLIQEFGIQQKVAQDVERIFKETMETAGILHDNGILKNDSNQDEREVPIDNEGDESDLGHSTKEAETDKSNPTFKGYLSVNLPSGLIVSYSQDLASAFAFGTFGVALKQLNDDVEAYIKSTNINSATSDEEA